MATGPFVDNPPRAGDVTLIKTVRSLDKGTQPTAEKLNSLWTALTATHGGSYHASEEVLLRWLLKNMKADNAEGGCFRRFPLVWNILGCVFTRIPLFSLAKSLSERQFVQVLRQTLAELGKSRESLIPVSANGSDVDMVDATVKVESATTRKRKRSTWPVFDLDKLREPSQCLESADAVFGAVRRLLGRIDVVTKCSSHEKMGAEHVKSLFSTSAKEAVELIRPMVEFCDSALSSQTTESVEDQETWTALIQTVWDFHLQGQQDAYEVATTLSPSLCSILSKLLGFRRQQELSISPEVQAAWTKDLKRFFTKAMIIPARSSYLNRKDLSVLEMAVEIIKDRETTSAPVLFNLVLSAPLVVGEASAKKNNEEWIQKVFTVLEEPLRRATSVERTRVISLMLEMARQNGASLAPDSLRAVCNSYAFGDAVNWELIYRIAAADIDVFLISQNGADLLTSVLDRTTSLEDVVTEDQYLAGFISTLASGFAQSRDLSSFVKKWFECLSKALAKHNLKGSIAVWSSVKIQDEVSRLLQTFMTTKQLVSLLDWLGSHDNAFDSEALLVILDTIAQGVNEDDYVDAITTRLFDMTSSKKLSASVSPQLESLRWSITEKTINRVTSAENSRIWDEIKPKLIDRLENGSVEDELTLRAFRCAYAVWIQNYPGGVCESEASALVSAFLGKLESHNQRNSVFTSSKIWDQALSEMPHLFDLITEKSGNLPSIVQAHVIKLTENEHVVFDAHDKILSDENNLNNRALTSNLIKETIQQLSTDTSLLSNSKLASGLALFSALLEIPQECFSRDQRESLVLSVMKFLQSQRSVDQDIEAIDCWKIPLSLMTKLMQRPTFYENMKFRDLIDLGDSLMLSSRKAGPYGTSPTYDVLRLFTEYAKLTLKQMTSNMEHREQEYLSEAAVMISSWSTKRSSSSNGVRLLLLSAMLIALENSSNFRSIKQPPINVQAIRLCLSSEAALFLNSIPRADNSDPVILVCLEQLNATNSLTIQANVASSLKTLEITADKYCNEGLRAGWKLKALLAKHFKEHPDQFFLVQLANGSGFGGMPLSEEQGNPIFNADRDDVVQYINTIIDGLNGIEQLQQLRDLLSALNTDPAPLGRLLAVHRLVDASLGSEVLASSRIENFDLATAHSMLSRHLVQTSSKADFALTAQILYTLLDKKASEMSQWNIEVTLSSVSTICTRDAADTKKYSRKGYTPLCRLIEIITKRHRLRLEGHFHLLITVLQALLTDLLSCKPHDSTDISRRDDAKAYSRLLTLVCEPSVASVTRSQPSSLDSATDAAKRLAGQHMYLVLMLYIKLQLEHSIPHDIREALEPGIYSILDISPMEIRRIMNDAMDGSGRAIFKELYKQYLKFGKWSGV